MDHLNITTQLKSMSKLIVAFCGQPYSGDQIREVSKQSRNVWNNH